MTAEGAIAAETAAVDSASGDDAEREPRASLLRAVLLTLGRAARRAWGVTAPVRAVVSRFGWLVLAAAVVAIGAGLVVGWLELIYLGLTLAAALVIATVFLIGRASYRVTVELDRPRVVAGERAFGRLLVANAGSRAAGASRMELPVGAGVAEFVIPGLAAGAEHDELFAVPTQRRAVIVAGPPESVRGDHLGLLRRTVRWADPVELFVHPRTARLDPTTSGLVRDLEGEVTTKVTDNDMSFHALRAYEPGDDRRNVHWRTSARTGQLMVRQFEESRRSHVTILQTVDPRRWGGEEEFELGVSVAASLGVQVIRSGIAVSSLSEHLLLATRTPVALLDDSCRLEVAPTPHRTLRDFARTGTRRLPAPSIVMMVAGSTTELAEFRQVEAFFGADTRAIAFRVDPSADAGYARVGALTVLTVPALEDLVRLVGRFV
jgi:hypothetical protein